MSRLTRKFASVSIAVATIVWLSGATFIAPANAMTNEEMIALIAQLTQQIQVLQAQLTSSSGGSTSSYNFATNLTIGSKGADVTALQNMLIAGGYLKIASATGYFGTLTQTAVAAWQKANNISPAAGYFGPKSRQVANATAGTGGTTTGGVVVIPTDSYLKVEAAGPLSATVPDGSLYTPVLKLKLTAGKDAVNVTGVTVTRGGFVANTNVTGVSVWDDAGIRYGNIVTALTADGKATVSFSGSPFTVPAGQTKYLTVAVNLSASTGSGTISMSVDAATGVVVSGSVPVQGTFPLTGNIMTIVDGSTSLADVYLDDQSVGGLAYATISSATGNLEVGNTAKEVFKLRITQNNSKEAVKLEKLVVYYEGTAQEGTDLKNWKLYSPEGNVLATAEKAVDRYVTFNLATPYVVDKGLSKDLSVKVDVMDGSGRYFRVLIQNDYDVVVKGVTTGASIVPLDSAGAALTSSDTQNANGGFMMKAGTISVSKTASSPSGNVAPGSNNIVLAKFDLKAVGEKIDIRKIGLYVDVASTTGASSIASSHQLTGTISVKDASTGETYLSISADTTGIQGSSTVATSTMDTYQQNLSSYIYVESGQTKTIEVVGSTPSTATSSASYLVSIGMLYGKRYSTNDYTTLSSNSYDANSLSVTNVALTVTKSASFANTNRAKGAQGVKIAEFVLQASSADDIKITNLSIDIASSTNVQNVKLMDGTTQIGSTASTPSASSTQFALDNFVVTKSQSKTIGVYADVLSNVITNDTVQVTVPVSGITGYGVASSKSLDSTPSANTFLQTITLKTGTLTVSKDSSAPTTKIVMAGQTGVELNKIRFDAYNEDLNLKKITLILKTPSTSATSGWPVTTLAGNFSNVYLYDGTTLLNTGGSPVSSADGTVTISGLNVTLPQGTPKILTVKADISASGVLTPASVGAVAVNGVDSTNIEVYSTAGLMTSGITDTSSSTSAYFLFTDAAPAVANAWTASATKGSVSTLDEVGRFTISNTAPSGGREITIEALAFTALLGGDYTAASSSSAVVQTFKLYDTDGSLIATTTAATAISGNDVDYDISFATTSAAWVTYGTGSLKIAAGSSKTVIVKADTTSIRTGLTSTTGKVYLTIKGTATAKGYLSTDVGTGPEYYWNTGDVTYKYTSSDGSNTVHNLLTGFDSAEVVGTTLTY